MVRVKERGEMIKWIIMPSGDYYYLGDKPTLEEFYSFKKFYREWKKLPKQSQPTKRL